LQLLLTPPERRDRQTTLAVQAVVGVAAARLHMAGPAGLVGTFATALLAPIPVSLAVHRWVEEPLGRVAAAAMRFVPGGHPGNARAELP
jgi:hypothetical protein